MERELLGLIYGSYASASSFPYVISRHTNWEFDEGNLNLADKVLDGLRTEVNLKQAIEDHIKEYEL